MHDRMREGGALRWATFLQVQEMIRVVRGKIMTKGKRLLLPLAISAVTAGANVYAQPADELDITITVMQEGETPEGFVNRIELPPLDTLSDDQTGVQAEVSDIDPLPVESIQDTIDSIADLADEAAEVVTDAIREVISIDGTTGATVDVLPPGIGDLLPPDLPLQDSLQDVLDEVLDDVVDEVVDDLVDEIVDDIVDDVVEDLVDDAVDDVSDVVDDIVDNITDDAVDDLVDDLVDDTVGGVTDDIVDDVTGDATVDALMDDLVGDDVQETDDLLDDIGDILP